MFKIITMCDSNYFDCGKLFLQTRKIVKDHDIVLYHPDMTPKQLKILDRHNIEHRVVDKKDWDTKMQYMKIEYVLQELKKDQDKKYKGFLLIDWDVFFVNDFSHIYNNDFDLCVIVRPKEVKRRTFRAYGCGGGFFFKHSAKGLFEMGKKTILNGGHKKIPEYDRIWKTLERGRPEHKTHFRTALRWWVDQVFISCIVLRLMNEHNYKIKIGLSPKFSIFNGYNIAFVNERYYNRIKSNAIIKKEKNIFIKHLQEYGRKQIVGNERAKIKEKLDG